MKNHIARTPRSAGQFPPGNISRAVSPSSSPTPEAVPDTIPAVLAAAQHAGRSGHDLIRGVATAYEIRIAQARGICPHAHEIGAAIATARPRCPSART